jgi:hypothetical protein
MKPSKRIKRLVHISFARDKRGYWWGETSDPTKLPDHLHGPFRTEAEAEKNAERVTLGDVKVEDADQVMHGAPEKKQ